MMKAALIFRAMTALVLLAPVNSAVASVPFECPTQLPAAKQAEIIRNALPQQEDFENPAKVGAAIDLLETNGTGFVMIADNLIAAYCPYVAADTAQTDEQKTTLVKQFALGVTRTVYSMDSEDQIIFDLTLSPKVVDQINAKASAAGITPQAWATQAIATRLGQ